MQILLSNSQAGPGRRVKQEQKEISRNHVKAFIPGSVVLLFWKKDSLTIVLGIIPMPTKTVSTVDILISKGYL